MVDFHLVTFLQLAILTISDAIAVVAKILKCQLSVWQIRDFHAGARLQIGRTDFIIRHIKIGIAAILNLRQFVPMGKAEIAGYCIQCTGMRRPFILGKTNKAFQRCCPNAYSRLARNVKRQEFAV